MDRPGTRDTQVLVSLLAGIVGIGLVMVFFGREHPATSLLLLFPLAAAVLLPPARTAVVSVVAWLVASLALLEAEGYDTGERLSRIGILALAGAAAVWLASARVARENRMRQMTRVAETAQRAIIRAMPTALGRVAIAARYLSAADDALVGGDLYEVVPSPYGVRVIVGDVRGKGLAAVKLASAVLGVFRFEATQEPSLAALAQHLDGVVRNETDRSGESEDFVTAVLVEVGDDLGVRFVVCGHPSPLVVRRDDAHLLEILTRTPPLSLGIVAKTNDTRWQPGTRVLLYTDGLIEARDASGRFFPVEGEAETLRGGDLEASLDAVVQHVVAYSGGHLGDDLAAVLLECR